MFNPLTKDARNYDDRDEADFLDEEGQLKYELVCELDEYMQQGVNYQKYPISFMKEGTVHHPELFEAVCKGFKIDTSDFSINTAETEKFLEGHHNV